jgi:hypothetical protein
MKVRFSRFELKYLLPAERCQPIIDELRQRIAPDPHGGAHGYPVISLYYDSPDYACFWAKIEGLKYRRKLRVRIYPGDDLSQVRSASVEIKQRLNRTVHKRRLFLPLEEARALCAGEHSLTGLTAEDRLVAEEVTFLRRSLELRPTAITAYFRRAYQGEREDAGLRITFDTHIRARLHALEVNEAAVNRLIFPENWCVLEVKVDERVPDWVVSLLARHSCQLGRVSKYCASLCQLHAWKVLPLALSPGVPLPTLFR